MAVRRVFCQSLKNPVVVDFGFYSVVVLMKMFFVSAMITYFRITKAVYTNQEDVKAFYKGSNPDKKKPITGDEDVERVRRIHLNDLENIPAFIFLGMLYVLTDPSPWAALWHFRVFGIARIVHSFMYWMGVQPWRAACHFACLGVCISMGLQVLSVVW